jgi:hypothetical protein
MLYWLKEMTLLVPSVMAIILLGLSIFPKFKIAQGWEGWEIKTTLLILSLWVSAQSVERIFFKTKDFEKELAQLAKNADYPFQKKMIETIKEQYTGIVKFDCIHFNYGRRNAQYMKIAVDLTKVSIKGISVHTTDGWKNDLTQYDKANMDAIERGVKITRIFIIPDKIYVNNDNTEITSLISLMNKQSEYKTDVKYAFEDEIKTILPSGEIYSCALFDNELFGYDIRYSLDRDYAEEICITWNKEEIKQKNIIQKIENSKYINNYDSTEECRIRIMSHKPIK